MKKTVIVIFTVIMIVMLAACSKNETGGTSDNGGTNVTETVKQPENTASPAENKQETTPEPTAEPAPKAAAEPTAEPTPEATPEPTAEPTPEPEDDPETDTGYDDEFDEFYSDGHAYSGLWQGDNGWRMTLSAEGAADIITVYTENTDGETFGSSHQFWTNFIDDVFISTLEFFSYYDEDGPQRDTIEGENKFELRGDQLYWVEENVTFTKISDDPFGMGESVSSGDPADDDEEVYESFGVNFHLEDKITVADLFSTSFYGYYLEYAFNNGRYYPYYGDAISWDTMDEFDCAYIDLGAGENEGSFGFLERVWEEI